VNHVEIAAAEAEIANTSFEADRAAFVGEFGVGDEFVPGCGAAVEFHGEPPEGQGRECITVVKYR